MVAPRHLEGKARRLAPSSHRRGGLTRRRILVSATRLFAERGFRHARLEDIANDLGITKTAVLRHFATKENLFFEVYREAALSFSSYMEAPKEILDIGFFATFRYWLEHTEQVLRENPLQYRILLVGKYGTDIEMKRQMSRLWLTEDPDKTLDFLEFGIRQGEVRSDIDHYIVAAIIDWVVDGYQESLAAEEIDRGLFHRREDGQKRSVLAIDTIVELLERAIGTGTPAVAGDRYLAHQLSRWALELQAEPARDLLTRG